jgi:hypothetical protein
MTKLKSYEEHVKEKYPEAYGQWALGHCIITDGEDNAISDLIKGTDKAAREEAWKNAYEKIKETE